MTFPSKSRVTPSPTQRDDRNVRFPELPAHRLHSPRVNVGPVAGPPVATTVGVEGGGAGVVEPDDDATLFKGFADEGAGGSDELSVSVVCVSLKTTVPPCWKTWALMT